MAIQRTRKGLQKKLFLIMLIVGLLPGIVALFETYLYSKEILTRSIGSNFQVIAAAVAKKIEMIVDHDIQEAESLALTPEVRSSVLRANRSAGQTAKTTEKGLSSEGQGQWEQLSELDPAVKTLTENRTARYLKDWKRDRRKTAHYGNLLITDQFGSVIASTRKPAVPSFSEKRWFKSSFQEGKGEIYISTLYYKPGEGEYYYDIAVPIYNPEHTQAIGTLKTEIPRTKLLKAVLEVHVGQTGHAMLVSSTGTPLICPILPPKEHLINAPLMRQITKPKPAWAVAEDDAHGGENALVGFSPIRLTHPLSPSSLDRTEWYTFVRQHPEETYAPVYGLLVKVGMVGFGLVLAISFIGYFAGKHIVQPIRLLQKRAQSIGQSSYELATQERDGPGTLSLKDKIDIQTGDEIEELAQAFNQMSSALDETLQTIKKQQGELVQKEKLATAGQLLAGLTHDLKNPLSVIRSSAQLLLDRKEKEEVKKELGQYIIEEVDRMTRRINDFLRFSRPRAPERRKTSPETVVEQTLWQWTTQKKALDNLCVEKKIPGPLPKVHIDPEQIIEALFNLLNNASEAMPEGGTLTVEACENGGGFVEIRVQDTGEGIAHCDLDRIFEPFYSNKAYGVGLGLTNVKRLIEENGGTLSVESRIHHGTLFKIAFPSEKGKK